LVYAGTLKRKFGILNLVKAVHALDKPNIELMICGRGDAEDAIVEYTGKDPRIQLLGQISAEESAALIQSATVLVNPRQNNEEYTQYSFPIKTMEYLLSGVPVVAYVLDGMPDEYKDHLFLVEDDSIEALSRKIEEVMNMPESVRREFGLAAREFVIRTKTSEVACERIINMINGTYSNGGV
jgi:glycosyltransferase involved in cell wall biosynthesis